MEESIYPHMRHNDHPRRRLADIRYSASESSVARSAIKYKSPKNRDKGNSVQGMWRIAEKLSSGEKSRVIDFRAGSRTGEVGGREGAGAYQRSCGS